MASWKNSFLKNEIIKYAKETLESSSIHAIPNITRNKFSIIKLMWFICFCISFYACVLFMAKSINDYGNYDIVTNVKINYVQKLPFPVVSICHLGIDMADNLTNLLNNSLIECNFNKIDCNLENDFEYYEDSNYGKCLRFNSPKNDMVTKYTYSGGEFNAFYSSFRLLNSSISDSMQENGLIVFLSNNEIIDSNYVEGIKLSPGFSFNVIINKYTISRQPKPYSNCIDDLTRVESYDSECYRRTINGYKNVSYKYSFCSNMCLQKFIGDSCNIQIEELGPVYYKNKTLVENMSDDYLECLTKNVILFKSSSEVLQICDCPLECDTSGFTYSLSFAQLSKAYFLNKMKKMNEDFKYKNDEYLNYISVVSFKIYYMDLKETLIIHDIKTQLADLIANLGGTLGLFLGLSFLSFIEIFEILFQSIIIIHKNKNQNM